MLGVGAATVRRWTAAGRLKAFITPGGHRRYQRADITNLAGTARSAGTADDWQQIWKRRASTAADSAQSQPWHAAYDESEKIAARASGRKLVQLAASYVATPDQRPQVLKCVRELAIDYGRQAARIGMSLGDLLDAFGHFRRSLLEAHHLPGSGEDGSPSPTAPKLADVVLDLSELLDVFNLEMVEQFVASLVGPLVAPRSGTTKN
jgi:hypothetical protein